MPFPANAPFFRQERGDQAGAVEHLQVLRDAVERQAKRHNGVGNRDVFKDRRVEQLRASGKQTMGGGGEQTCGASLLTSQASTFERVPRADQVIEK
nr:hypothetical protein GCM10020185_73270 [Pseudomonas brassicacearum subsp. brassicacearum]